MKYCILIISLLSLVLSSPVVSESNTDVQEIVKIVKCFLEQQPLIDDVKDIVDMISTQDYSKAITIAFKTYADVQSAISTCIKQDSNESLLGVDWWCVGKCDEWYKRGTVKHSKCMIPCLSKM